MRIDQHERRNRVHVHHRQQELQRRQAPPQLVEFGVVNASSDYYDDTAGRMNSPDL